MKKTLLLLLLMLAPAFAALAQYIPAQIEQSRGRLLDDQDEVIPDFMVQRLVGDEIYEETYVGAVKQYKTGKRLLFAGIAGMGAGVAVTGVSTVTFFVNYIKMWGPPSEEHDPWQGLSDAKDSLDWMLRGAYIAGIGFSVFTMGVIFKSIGKKRLEWVADDYNERHPVSLRFGNGQYGTGLVFNF